MQHPPALFVPGFLQIFAAPQQTALYLLIGIFRKLLHTKRHGSRYNGSCHGCAVFSYIRFCLSHTAFSAGGIAGNDIASRSYQIRLFHHKFRWSSSGIVLTGSFSVRIIHPIMTAYSHRVLTFSQRRNTSRFGAVIPGW